MIRVFRCATVFNRIDLPESIYNKVELYDLRRALRWIPPYIDLSLDEYLMIKKTT